MDLLAGITCIVLYKLSRKIHRVLKIPIWFGRELLNNSCVLYCAAVSEKYEDQSQRNPYVTLSRLAPHFEDEIAGLQKWPFLAGFGLFWTHVTNLYGQTMYILQKNRLQMSFPGRREAPNILPPPLEGSHRLLN